MIDDEEIMVRYLLGDLPKDRKEWIEEQYFTNNEYHDELLATERDLIDRYVHDELSDKEREQFENYFLSSPARHQRVEFARALMKYCSTREEEEKSEESSINQFRPSWTQAVFSSKLRMAAAAIIVIGLGLGIWWAIPRQPKLDEGMAVLRTVYRNNRPLQARVSMLDYAPSSAERGYEPDVDDRNRRRAELIISEEAEDHPDPKARHALGVVYLANHQFKEAIKEFEAALKDDPKNARLYSDLGAAFFEKGKFDKRKGESDLSSQELTQSLEYLNKAINMDGSLLDALFNIALLHQMILPRQAEEDWLRYLEKDSASPWAEEARANLKNLQESKRTSKNIEQIMPEFLDAFRSGDEERAWKIISRNREPITGKLIFWQLLESYLSLAAQERNDEAREKISALAYAGKLESIKTGDNYVRDLAMLYQSASAKQLSLLSKAHKLINKGHEQCRRSKYKDAGALYDLAGGAFEEAGSRWEARYADYWAGYCLLQSPQKEKALSILEDLFEAFEKQEYLWLAALTLNSLANAKAVLSEYSEAIDCTKKSLKISKRLDDSYNVQKNLAQLAQEYNTLGNYDQALIYIHRCLESANDDWPGARQMWRSYDTMAQTLKATGRLAAAADYQREALHLALGEANDPSFTYVSYVHLGMIYGEMDKFAEGIELAEKGYQTAESFDERTRLKATGYCSLLLGHLNRRINNYDTAIDYYDRAITNYNEIEYPSQIYNAHKGRFISYVKRGDDGLAREELQTVLSLLKQYRARILEESNRNTFLEAEQSVYDIAIEFAHSRLREYETAFEYSELARSRSLLDLITTNAHFNGKNNDPDIDLPDGSEPMKLADIKTGLTEKTQILQYDVLDDKLLVWVISKKRFEVREQSIPLSELDRKTRQYLKSVWNREDVEEINEKAKELYTILIAPVESLLDPDRQLCIVPDKILNLLPFASLVSPASNQYLVRSHRLSFSSSSTVLIKDSEIARRMEGSSSENILSVGSPTFNIKYHSLSALPESAEEAVEVAKFYNSSSRVLLREQATKSRVKSHIQSSDVIHLASHYIADKQSSMLSKLLLADESTGEGNDQSSEGELQAYEVYAMKLARARLAVLSACQTGVEKYYDGEGMIGMARTFIAAGVPLVVASLWPVDSDATKELMVSFHRHRKLNPLSTAKALREAQLDMLMNSKPRYSHPYYWASFALFGGYASF